jgi:hypothetical protein
VYVWAMDCCIPALTLYTHLPPDHPDSDDPSSKMWALCISKIDKHESKADMEGILIYVSMVRIFFNGPSYLSKAVFRWVCSLQQLPHLKATSYSSLVLVRYQQDLFETGRLQCRLPQYPMEYTCPPDS